MNTPRLARALLITAALLAAAPAVASADGVFASSSAASKGSPVGTASSSHRLSILLTLRGDDAGLKAYASAVSDPSSPLYGKYLTPAQIGQRFGSSASDRARVVEVLRAAGLKYSAGLGNFWINTEATVAQASALFSTGFASYRARNSAKRYVAPTAKPQLPASLAGTVTGVVGLDDSPAVTPAIAMPLTRQQGLKLNAKQRLKGSSVRANLGTQSGCAAGREAGFNLDPTLYIPAYTPNQISSAYGLSDLHKKGFKGQGQRVTLLEVDGFDRSDLETAGACFGYKPPPTTLGLIGLKSPLPPGGETTLDLQVLAAAAPGLSSIHVLESANNYSDLVKMFAVAVEHPHRPRPSVISASVGTCEPTLSGQMPVIVAWERVLQAAATAGITVVASTGDTGSSGCDLDNNSSALPLLTVWYPASSEWVTGVGGTNFSLNSANKITEEVVWNDSPSEFGGSVGGYSLLFEKPLWQVGLGVDPGNLVRTVPDVTLLGDGIPGYAIYAANVPGLNGWKNVGGTSAATPLFAAGVAIANQQAKAAGQSRLGFLNPTIYKLAAKASTRNKVFRDVTKVGNDLGKLLSPAFTNLGCCSATKYYDVASGWGSVNFPHFSYEARKLGARTPSAVTGSYRP